MDELVGKRVRLVGDHPHAGTEGVGERIQKTAFGATGLVVKLRDSHTDGCFVFDRRHVVEIDANHREVRRRR